MRCFLFAMLLTLGAAACAGTTKKVQPSMSSVSLGTSVSSFDDLNLVVSSTQKTPVGEVMIPKTTDLDSVLLVKPILFLDNKLAEENDERE